VKRTFLGRCCGSTKRTIVRGKTRDIIPLCGKWNQHVQMTSLCVPSSLFKRRNFHVTNNILQKKQKKWDFVFRRNSASTRTCVLPQTDRLCEELCCQEYRWEKQFESWFLKMIVAINERKVKQVRMYKGKTFKMIIISHFFFAKAKFDFFLTV